MSQRESSDFALDRCHSSLTSEGTRRTVGNVSYLHTWKGVERGRDGIMMLHTVYMGEIGRSVWRI
jgi:hypothetical protein